MRYIKASLAMACVILLGVGYAYGAQNMLANGGFEDGVIDPWSAYGDATAEVVQAGAIEGQFCLHITVNTKGANFWDAGLSHAGHTFEAGKVYTLSAYLKAKEVPFQINFKPELAADPWTGYGSRAFAITREWEQYYITTPPMPENVDPATITFHIAYDAGEFWIDDARFYEGSPDVGPDVGLVNGGFEASVPAPWSLYGDGSIEVVEQLTGAAVPEDPIEGEYALHVTVNQAGANFWDVGLGHGGHIFEQGKVYTLAAFLKSKSGTLQINFKPELDADPWTGYGSQEFTMTETWEEYYVTTPPMPEEANPASLTFHIAYTAGEFWMDGVRFFEGEYMEPAAVKPQGKLGTVWGKIKAE
jgi:hypothetical protein